MPAPAPAPAQPVYDIMQMAVGKLAPDLQYDANGDGQITSRDALMFQQSAQAPEPSGIETMAESVGQGDYLSGISMPDGSSFDVNTLSQVPAQSTTPSSSRSDYGFEPSFGIEPTINVENPSVGPDLSTDDPVQSSGGDPAFDSGMIGFGPVAVEGGYSYDGDGNEINSGPLGGGTREEPSMQGGTLGGNVYDENGNLVGNLGSAGPRFGEEPAVEGGFSYDEPYAGFDEPQGGADPEPSENLYPFLPADYDTSNQTPESLSALNDWFKANPNGLDLGNINVGIGGIYSGGNYTGLAGGNTSGSVGNSPPYTVTSVGLVDNLGTGASDGSAGLVDNLFPSGTDNTEGGGDAPPPYVVPDVRSESSYALTGAAPTRPVAPNPFVRPESQQGLGSLAGGS